METMNVETVSVTRLKNSPSKVIERAKKTKNGVYVLNRNNPEAVVLGVEDYENLVKQLNELDEKLYDLEVEKRLKNIDKSKLYSDYEVRGDRALITPKIDDNDGWD